jgi:hypothetical protein
MPSTFLIFFRAGSASLEGATDSLAGYGLTVVRKDDYLEVSRLGSPTYRVRIAQGSHVSSKARDIAAGTPYEEAMRDCNECFEVTINDLDEALDEVNTLMEIQGALQDVSGGHLFLPWNGSFSERWQD